MKAKYPELSWVAYDTSRPENIELLSSFLVRSGRAAA
jgi:hypothetical protein